MALDKTDARLAALTFAHEARLFVDEEGVYFAGATHGNRVHEVDEATADAAQELVADGDLEAGETGAGPNGLTPVPITAQGETLYEEWTA